VPITDISNIDDWKVRDTRAHTHSVCVRCLAHNPSLLVDKDGCMCEQNISHTLITDITAHDGLNTSHRVCVCVCCVCVRVVCACQEACAFFVVVVITYAYRGLRCVARYCSVLQRVASQDFLCVAVCCSVLQRVASQDFLEHFTTTLSVCCSVLQRVASHYFLPHFITTLSSTWFNMGDKLLLNIYIYTYTYT